MDATRRALTETELDTIMEMLLKERHEHGSPILSISDPFQTRLYLHTQSHHGHVVIFSEEGVLAGILLFSVGGLWWSKETVLFEELVLSVSSFAGVQRKAIEALNHLAKEYHCALIVCGCLIQEKPQMVMNGYQKAGFHVLAPIAIKRLKGGDSTCSPM